MTEFLGAPLFSRSFGGFASGHWIVGAFGDAVKRHEHRHAHLMFIVAGEYVSSAAGPADARLVYNPPNTVHRDRFESEGSFFAVSMPEIEGLPAQPTKIADHRSHALMLRLIREDCVVAESLCYDVLASFTLEAKHDPSWLRSAREMLSDGYAEPITIRDVSRAAGVHPIHLTRSFRRAYGCTPGDYLRSRRVEKAAELLVSSDRSLTDVALETGFADQSHFTKHFRRAMGVPPGEYRRRCLS